MMVSNMNEDITKASTIELIKDLTLIERKLELYLFKYDLIRAELIKRVPTLENDDNFQPRFSSNTKPTKK